MLRDFPAPIINLRRESLKAISDLLDTRLGIVGRRDDRGLLLQGPPPARRHSADHRRSRCCRDDRTIDHSIICRRTATLIPNCSVSIRSNQYRSDRVAGAVTHRLNWIRSKAQFAHHRALWREGGGGLGIVVQAFDDTRAAVFGRHLLGKLLDDGDVEAEGLALKRAANTIDGTAIWRLSRPESRAPTSIAAVRRAGSRGGRHCGARTWVSRPADGARKMRDLA